jgi:hypothetical protein
MATTYLRPGLRPQKRPSRPAPPRWPYPVIASAALENMVGFEAMTHRIDRAESPRAVPALRDHSALRSGRRPRLCLAHPCTFPGDWSARPALPLRAAFAISALPYSASQAIVGLGPGAQLGI